MDVDALLVHLEVHVGCIRLCYCADVLASNHNIIYSTLPSVGWNVTLTEKREESDCCHVAFVSGCIARSGTRILTDGRVQCE